MNTKQAAQAIRDTVTMDQILQLYGYTTKRGFMRCPFHGEKTASLKVYRGTGGWHCYGCERGGSVVDFVMEHENCDFRTAVTAIDKALSLGLTDPHEMPADAYQFSRIQKALDNFVETVFDYCDTLIRRTEEQRDTDYKHLKELEELQYGQAEKLTADDYTFLMTWKEEDQYNAYKVEKINEFKEEVAAWRRKARRAE
jgi:hypothetical protein